MKLNNNDDSHNSGLNLLIYNMLLDIESHPAWVCGLKQKLLSEFEKLKTVTPCVGVWIETCMYICKMRFATVTPCVGVWIETFKYWRESNHMFVTPCVGVWIETGILPGNCTRRLSHPAWVCGLKR